ncbi:MAG: hypothetical protein LUD72_06690 [Bacteroidales bacterium]|nr:hypothetical protein [Bacteroidales bacterium]MCD8207604.1 hypothetical protein [Bacteroidales bacterium]
MKTENKRMTCSMLCQALQSCRQFDDLLSLKYRKEPVNAEDTHYYEEYVTATFMGGGKREICVTADSCWGMVRDIIKNIDG